MADVLADHTEAKNKKKTIIGSWRIVYADVQGGRSALGGVPLFCQLCVGTGQVGDDGGNSVCLFISGGAGPSGPAVLTLHRTDTGGGVAGGKMRDRVPILGIAAPTIRKDD